MEGEGEGEEKGESKFFYVLNVIFVENM